MQKNFWLHVTECKSASRDAFSTYMLSMGPLSSPNSASAAAPMVHRLTWEQLLARLSAVGVRKDELVKAKNELDAKGSYAIAEVSLTDSQIEPLGFIPATV